MKTLKPETAGVILALFILCFASTSFSQTRPSETNNADVVSKPVYHISRYMIVQSPLGAKATFKLDTYTGDVYQLEKNPLGMEVWILLKRQIGLMADTTYPNSNNYSLFVSSIGIRYTYLINVNTGATWQWVVDSSTNESLFQPMSDSL